MDIKYNYNNKNIDIFIINLENQKSRLTRTMNELKKCNINDDNIYRFNAVNGKQLNFIKNDNIHPICNLICTDSMKGCGLSHINLSKLLYKKKYDYALVLEDDVKIEKCKLNNILNNIINRFNNIDINWDIILLFYQGFCTENKKTTNKLCGSTAAYLISNNGMKKLSNIKLLYHIDYIRNSSNFNTYVGPLLFRTYDPKFENKILNYNILNQNVNYWLKQPMLKIPIINLDINLLISFIVILFLIILFFLIYKKPYVYFFTGFILTLLTIYYYSLYDTNYYKISDNSHIFGILFPILVILYLFTNKKILFYLIFSLSVVMLNFHLIYHFER